MNFKAIIGLLFAVVLSFGVLGMVDAQEEGDAFSGSPDRQSTGLMGELVQIVTDTTGLNAQEIREAVQDGATIADVIVANGGDVEAVVNQLMTTIGERLGEAVNNGQITQERADDLLQNARSRITDFLTGERPLPQRDKRDGRNRNRPAIEDRIGGELLRTVMETTGLELPKIQEAVQNGSTLADLIIANGSTVDAVVAEILSFVQEQADAALESGRATQEQVDQLLGNVEAGVRNRLESEAPLGGNTPNLGTAARGLVQAVANELELGTEEIVSQLQAGASLAGVLAQNGVAIETFIDNALIDFEQQLMQAVDNGRISQAVADARLNLRRVELIDALNRTLDNN